MAKFGHVKGTKKERKGSQDWFKAREAEIIAQVEHEWQAKQQLQSKKEAL